MGLHAHGVTNACIHRADIYTVSFISSTQVKMGPSPNQRKSDDPPKEGGELSSLESPQFIVNAESSGSDSEASDDFDDNPDYLVSASVGD